ncbi:DUF1284 domain-containing protein [Rossellomorea vietnamensis]|uniref:DUF1284 domain-containing protein n=1 Tax=Rossellomorea vietnamensis TaxID=218284 RepID=A0A5D4MDU0_9BACI|nr:DUF1284 domain-containing protein [Rossellomorea vietnamensis]TYS00005.1 DUF1284 domain-containing protein [Rossellomorea vietnamensis]
MGYSPSFVEKMKEIVGDMRDPEKDFDIRVIAGFDDACSACPHRGETLCSGSVKSNNKVMGLDRRTIDHLGLESGRVYKKSYLVELTAKKVEPDDLDQICAGCSWLEYGVCKEGIALLNEELVQK